MTTFCNSCGSAAYAPSSQNRFLRRSVIDPQPIASLCANNCLEGNHSRLQPKRASAMPRPSRELSDIGGRHFFFPALGSIEFGNGVGAQFEDSALDAVALVLAGA